MEEAEYARSSAEGASGADMVGVSAVWFVVSLFSCWRLWRLICRDLSSSEFVGCVAGVRKEALLGGVGAILL